MLHNVEIVAAPWKKGGAYLDNRGARAYLSAMCVRLKIYIVYLPGGSSLIESKLRWRLLPLRSNQIGPLG